jgi:hypothetical protein
VGNARVRKVPARLVEDEDYELRYERVAGIDVAKAKADVCTRLPPAGESGRRASRVETVGATARVVLALAGQLLADGIELVVMESTSDYWRIWFYLLETAGLNVQLVNSRQARQLAGRPKTDLLTELWGGVPQVSGHVASRVATFADHDHGRGSAAGSVAAGGAFARVA